MIITKKTSANGSEEIEIKLTRTEMALALMCFQGTHQDDAVRVVDELLKTAGARA